jgi:excisionase family DNA binding protein
MPEWDFSHESDFMKCGECGDPAFVIYSYETPKPGASRGKKKSALYCGDCACELGLVASTKQAAEKLGISTTTVRKMCREKRLDAAQDMGRPVCPWYVLLNADGEIRRFLH